MTRADFEPLAAALEGPADLSPETAAAVLALIRPLVPVKDRWPADRMPAIQSSDEVIHLVDLALPDWSISLKGRTNDTDGHWTCTLRRSDTLDDDLLIGIGRGPALPRAILAAMVRVAALRTTPKTAD
ncbi:hypothetical protein QKW60_16885 [Defluviimonas aestuarii]|uniref:hypothetical protein n=1 Tax=Albidovulum aestuarii TaxID=1130726 RepID=UPI00249B5B57|nr:hypothetical protein [Defluviimonas aestuarii]MDI3338086.1 hypothetical protein [Defluviimonas aestuarii]